MTNEMSNIIYSIIFLKFLITSSSTLPAALNNSNDTYWVQRQSILEGEISFILGNDLTLSAEEEEVNSYLMKLKKDEYDRGIIFGDFPASKNYFGAKSEIDKSLIFRFIQRMPKGAALHLHAIALTSIDWVISELTYWEGLYMCNATNDQLLFKFFNIPDEICSWKSVNDERRNYSSPEEFDAFIHSRLSVYTSQPEVVYPNINSVWTAFEKTFVSISGIITYDKAWESYFTRALQEFMEDNISYLETRGVLPLLYDKDSYIYTPEETLGFYQRVISNFSKSNEEFLGARYIYAPHRLVDLETVWGYVDLVIRLKNLYPDVLAGFDLVGQEDLGFPLTSFIEPILTLNKQDPPIPVFFHAGETNWEGISSDENLLDALLLNSSRIGHGYAISKHPLLMQIAREKDIPIEVCPLSNQILMLVNDLRNHPATYLAANSFPMVVSSDDPAVWEASPLSHDFYEAFMAIGGAKADLRFFKKLAMNSIKYSSLDEAKKLTLEVMWIKKWKRFINSSLINLRQNANEESNLIYATDLIECEH